MAEKPTVLLRTDGGPWHAPHATGYESEADLQRMLSAEPTLLPGVGDDARAVREFATRVGPADVVVVGADGTLTLVECKLASNEEARRKIVGQVFDYAARIWRMSREDFEARWVQRGGTPFDEWLDSPALETLDQALDDGEFRLVLAVDRITEDLRRIVEYLNAHTTKTVEVLAVELDLVRAGTVEVLIPTVYGTELVESSQRTAASRKPAWTFDDVRTYLTEHHPEQVTGIESLIAATERAGAVTVGTRGATPSFMVAVDTPSGPMYPLAFYTGRGRTYLNVNFEYSRRAGEDALEAFLNRTAAVLPEVDVEMVRAADYRKRPSVSGELLNRPEVIDGLVAGIEELVDAASHRSTSHSS